MKHHHPNQRDSVLRLAYLPRGAFVTQLITSLNDATSPDLKQRVTLWGPSKLHEAGLALSTKIAMLSLVAERLYAIVGNLYAELRDDKLVQDHIRNGQGWRTAERRLPFDVLLAVDSFIFEFRSCYEMFGAFMTTFFRHILGRNLTETALLEQLKRTGVDTSWTVDLRSHRKLFFHEISPWLAVSINLPAAGDRELLILYGPNADPTNPSQSLTLSRLRAIYGGFEAALARSYDWAIAEVQRLDAAPNAS